MENVLFHTNSFSVTQKLSGGGLEHYQKKRTRSMNKLLTNIIFKVVSQPGISEFLKSGGEPKLSR